MLILITIDSNLHFREELCKFPLHLIMQSTRHITYSVKWVIYSNYSIYSNLFLFVFLLHLVLRLIILKSCLWVTPNLLSEYFIKITHFAHVYLSISHCLHNCDIVWCLCNLQLQYRFHAPCVSTRLNEKFTQIAHLFQGSFCSYSYFYYI